MSVESAAPILLTPGPLTTAEDTRRAMLRDWGSRDRAFIALTARIRERLTVLAGGDGRHSCIPVQGSGTSAIEATLGTLAPRQSTSLVLINGAYGRRMAKILEILDRPHRVEETEEDTPPDPARLDAILGADPEISHVVLVHVETTSGILNPVEEIGRVVARHGRRLIVDAMSGFGAIPIDIAGLPCDAIVASANKCLEGVPGVGFAIVRSESLTEGNAHSLTLDLYDQWKGFEAGGQWRYTPPTHVLAALDRALELHSQEGAVAGRWARYRENCNVLVDGMRALGFETFLPDDLQAPIIVTFRWPADPRFAFDAFYDALVGRGYLIYPGKLTRARSFRIGCIGAIDSHTMRAAVSAVGAVMGELGIASGAPAAG
jgi:2-aminoethylphosphonate-pyruvate transaminase